MTKSSSRGLFSVSRVSRVNIKGSLSILNRTGDRQNPTNVVQYKALQGGGKEKKPSGYEKLSG